MTNLIKLAHEEYDEYWLDLDHVTSIGFGKTHVQRGMGIYEVKGVILLMTSGQKLVMPAELYDTLLRAKLNGSPPPPKDIDIPKAFLETWKDPRDLDLDKP